MLTQFKHFNVQFFSYVYELYSVNTWQIIILLELSRHSIELSIKLIVLSILYYSISGYLYNTWIMLDTLLMRFKPTRNQVVWLICTSMNAKYFNAKILSPTFGNITVIVQSAVILPQI